MQDVRRVASRALMLGCIGALVGFAAGGGLAAGLPWLTRARLLTGSLILGNCYAAAAVLLARALGFTPLFLWRPRTGSRFGWWRMFLIYLPLACLLGGSAALAILVPLGLAPPTRAAVINALFPYAGSLLGFAAVCAAVFSFGYLQAQIDVTASALRKKERQEEEARRLLAEAQLASLESRVQPHFLFNTLNSIAALVHSDPDGAERMTTELASLLRSSLNQAATPLGTVGEELAVVRTYLSIENVRFGDRLRFAIDVPGELEGVSIPRMSLQTIVENAVKYSVSPRREGGTIALTAKLLDHRCRFTVTDDGPGFDPTTLPPHHGLALVRDRLSMTFGERAALSIQSAPGSTAVTIEVPR